MTLARCLICEGELEILNTFDVAYKNVKCKQCGYNSENKKEPEITVIRKKIEE